MQKVSPSSLDRPGLRHTWHTSISQLTTTTKERIKIIWTSPRCFSTSPTEIVAKWSYQNSCVGGSHPLQHDIRRLGSSGGFVGASLPLCQMNQSPPPYYIRTQNVGAETSLINLARSSPSLHIFPILCFQSQCISKTVWHAKNPLGWLFPSLCPDSTK